MYSIYPSFVLGFHGCDKSVAEDIFSGKTSLRSSTNPYDWLGHGVYFWENNPKRALDFARQIKKYPELFNEKIKTPAVVGAIIDLGHSLDLSDAKDLSSIKYAYDVLFESSKSSGVPLPENKRAPTSKELIFRHLDCAVIEVTHVLQQELIDEGSANYTFDTVRGYFQEGSKLYENSGIRSKNHTQICVRNPNCIKGYFRVREPNSSYRIP